MKIIQAALDSEGFLVALFLMCVTPFVARLLQLRAQLRAYCRALPQDPVADEHSLTEMLRAEAIRRSPSLGVLVRVDDLPSMPTIITGPANWNGRWASITGFHQDLCTAMANALCTTAPSALSGRTLLKASEPGAGASPPPCPAPKPASSGASATSLPASDIARAIAAPAPVV